MRLNNKNRCKENLIYDPFYRFIKFFLRLENYREERKMTL